MLPQQVDTPDPKQAATEVDAKLIFAYSAHVVSQSDSVFGSVLMLFMLCFRVALKSSAQLGRFC